jgi:hypothetical protein
VSAGHLRRTPSGTGARYATDEALTAPLIGPEALRMQTLAHLHRAGDALHYTTLSEDTGDPTPMIRHLIDDRPLNGPFAVDDEDLVARHTVSSLLDNDGYLLRLADDSPLGHLEVERVRGDVVAAPTDGAPIGIAAEIAVTGFLRSPRSVTALDLKLLPLRAPLLATDFSGPGQTVSVLPAGALRLRTRQVGHDPASRTPSLPAELMPNALFTSDAPELLSLAKQLTTGIRVETDRIEAIVSFVHRTLTFDPGFAGGAPLDILHRRRGTCVAYATLTATLLRSLHLPSRVVYGYAYADGAFVGHAWTEVRTHGRWIAVDAALHSAPTADAARIALARADGHNGAASGLDQLARTLGQFRVEITAADPQGSLNEP